MSPEVATAPKSRSFPRSVTLFRYRGVPVRVDWSWAIIAALASWLFYRAMDGGQTLQGSTGVVATAAIIAAVLFFAGVLLHELGHAHTSLDRGVPVASVTLFMLGGVTESTREAPRARDELIIVGAGPFLSLTLGAALLLAYEIGPDAGAYAAITLYVGVITVGLGVINLVPAFPLDGGRLLRSILWAVTGRPHTATRWAARTGQGFAVALGGFGVWLLFRDGDFGGIWELIIALFLFRGAADAHRQATMRERFIGRTARQLMGSVPDALDPEQPLHHAVRLLQTKPSVLWPVGTPVTGVVRLADLERVDRADWSLTPVRDVTTPAEGATTGTDETMDTVLGRMQDAPGHMLVVVDDQGRAAGLLTPSLVTGAAAE